MGESGIQTFFESWPLFQDAVCAGVLGGAMLGVVGVYIVLRRVVFLSAAVSQVSGLGIAWAYFLQSSFGHGHGVGNTTFWAILVTLGALLLLWRDKTVGGPRRDAILGVIFLTGLSGTLLLSSRILEELHDVQTLLFGTAVAVLPEDFWRIFWVSIMTLALHLWQHRAFSVVSFDPQGARIRRLPVLMIDTVLMVSIGLAIAVSTQVLGSLPVFAFSILPAFAALLVVPNPASALVVAGVLGAIYGLAGYVVAFLWDLPVGASQTMVALLGLGCVKCISLVWKR